MSDRLAQLPAGVTTTAAGSAAGTTTTYTTANAQQFSIQGKAYVKAATANEATPTTDAVTGLAFTKLAAASSTGTVYVMCRDSAGALKAVQGSIETLEVKAAAGSPKFAMTAPRFPGIPSTLTPFAYLLVRACSDAAAAWGLGTENLAGPPTGILFTFVDVHSLPDRPQVA